MAAPERSPHPAGALDAAGGRLRADAPPEVRGGENLLRVMRRKASARRAASNPASWSSESAPPSQLPSPLASGSPQLPNSEEWARAGRMLHVDIPSGPLFPDAPSEAQSPYSADAIEGRRTPSSRPRALRLSRSFSRLAELRRGSSGRSSPVELSHARSSERLRSGSALSYNSPTSTASTLTPTVGPQPRSSSATGQVRLSSGDSSQGSAGSRFRSRFPGWARQSATGSPLPPSTPETPATPEWDDATPPPWPERAEDRPADAPMYGLGLVSAAAPRHPRGPRELLAPAQEARPPSVQSRGEPVPRKSANNLRRLFRGARPSPDASPVERSPVERWPPAGPASPVPSSPQEVPPQVPPKGDRESRMGAARRRMQAGASMIAGAARSSGPPTPEQKREQRRQHAIRELVETERTYASDLAVVRDVYLERARQRAGILASTPSSHSGSGVPLSSPGLPRSGTYSPLQRCMSSLSLGGAPLSPPSLVSESSSQSFVSAEDQRSIESGSPFGTLVPGGAPAPPLSVADIYVVFAGLERCAALAGDMCAALERAASADAGVAAVFQERIGTIEQTFSRYCSRHEAATARLAAISNREGTAAFLRECNEAARQVSSAWDLPSLLIKPVQRVLKYPLLLHSILECTDAAHAEHAGLAAALAQLQGVADRINENRKRMDIVERVGFEPLTHPKPAHFRLQPNARLRGRRGGSSAHGAGAVAPEPGPPTMEDEAQFQALVHRLDLQEARLQHFAAACTEWAKLARRTHERQLRLVRGWIALYECAPQRDPRPAERLHEYAAWLQGTMLGMLCVHMDMELRATVLRTVAEVVQVLQRPRTVMANRAAKEGEYRRFLADAARRPGLQPGRGALAFASLHVQLMEELPALLAALARVMDYCVNAFSRLQVAYFYAVAYESAAVCRAVFGDAPPDTQTPLAPDTSVSSDGSELPNPWASLAEDATPVKRSPAPLEMPGQATPSAPAVDAGVAELPQTPRALSPSAPVGAPPPLHLITTRTSMRPLARPTSVFETPQAASGAMSPASPGSMAGYASARGSLMWSPGSEATSHRHDDAGVSSTGHMSVFRDAYEDLPLSPVRSTLDLRAMDMRGTRSP